ncbi:MAG TPA: zf-HC2 domain-containing protein [Thermoanaerobaculia bacterium]
MDHSEATAAYATDRYLLGELTAAEADAFEEHFFDCADCADELRVGLRFMNGGHGMAREAAAPEEPKVVRLDQHRPRRTAWLPAAVAAALVLAVTTPLLLRLRPATGVSVGPSVEQTRQHSFLLEASRGAGDVPVLDGKVRNDLVLDVPVDPAYSRYEARIQRPGGPSLTVPVTPDPNGEPTSLSVSGLSAGAHELVIVGFDQGGRQTDLATYRFLVRR